MESNISRSVSLYSQDYTTTVLTAIVKLFVLLQNADVTDPDFLVTVDLTTCKASVVKKSPKPLPADYGIEKEV